MKKIPTIFKRDPNNMSRLLNQPHPDCHWVFNGEGVPTRKYDGTCCMVREGTLWKRREVKKGSPHPIGFLLEEEDTVTGKAFGWVRVTDDKSDKWHREALGTWNKRNGTFELVGPKVQGNPEGFSSHVLIPHGGKVLGIVPTDIFLLENWLKGRDIEGVVWHHPDGRMAKIKGRDFGLSRQEVTK